MASVRKRKSKKGTTYTVLYDYVDGTGERKQKSAGTFDTKAEAASIKLDIDSKKKRNKFVIPNDETVSEFIARWLPIRSKLEKWEYSYLSTATSLLEKHVSPEIGDIPMQKVTPIHIDSLFSKLQEKRCDGPKSYNRETEEVPFLSGSTLGSIYTLVKCFFDAAVGWKLIEENPVALKKPVRDDNGDMVIWDLNMTVVALANITHEQLHLMVHIASAHTCRNGELCGLTWDVVNLDNGMLKIDKTIQRVDKKAFEQLPQKEVFRIFPGKVDNTKSLVILKTPKTKGSTRWLCLTNPVIEELRLRKEQVDRDKRYYGKKYQNYNLVFCQEDGSPVEPNLLEKWFRRWQRRNGERLGLPYIEFHGLRHSATTLLMYLSGSDAKTVQSITGHSSAKLVFDVYNHPLMDNQRLLVKKLEHVLYGTAPQLELVSNPTNLSVEDVLLAIRNNPLIAQEVFSALHAEAAAPALRLAR